MGKSTISTGPFSIAMLNYQRVTLRTSFFFLIGDISIVNLVQITPIPMVFVGDISN